MVRKGAYRVNNLNFKNMKYLYFYLVFAVLQYANAQTIMPLENFKPNLDNWEGVPDEVTHIKDVNNLLNKFVGTWVGMHNNKNYEFRIIKVTGELIKTAIDQLQIFYKVEDSNGNIIENTIPLMPDYQNNGADLIDDIPRHMIIRGSYFWDSNIYMLDYYGRYGSCGQKGTINISADPNGGNNPQSISIFLASNLNSSTLCNGILVDNVLPITSAQFFKQ